MESTSAANSVILRLSGEGEEFEDFAVEKMVAMESEVIKKYMQEKDTDTGVEALLFPIPHKQINSGKVMELVLDYCRFHVHAKSNGISEEDVKIWDTDFAKKVVAAEPEIHTTAGHLLNAAEFLDVKGLSDLMIRSVADVVKDKTLDGIRRMFKKVNDFTEEEERAIRQETSWAYD